MSRVLLLLAVAGCLLAAQPLSAQQPGFHLSVVPAIIYKVDDPGGLKTSSFVFNISVVCSKDCDDLNPASAHVELSSAGSIVERQDWTAEMLAKVKRIRHVIEPITPRGGPNGAVPQPEAFDIRFYFRHPQALGIDSAAVRLTVADTKGRRSEQTLEIPIQYYQQKTALILPIRGHGIIGQDYITNGGHGGFWNAFGVDIDGLDQNDGELSDANENASDAGWGREILAPAAGTVVYARNDVPGNPRPAEPPDAN